MANASLSACVGRAALLLGGLASFAPTPGLAFESRSLNTCRPSRPAKSIRIGGCLVRYSRSTYDGAGTPYGARGVDSKLALYALSW